MDFYLRADTREGLLADLEPLGLVADGDFADASHAHTLAYIGVLPGASGVHLNLRALTDELAQAILNAHFEHATLVHPDTPACAWAE